MASIKYKDNGTYKDIVVKVGDTLPIGAEIDYEGAEVPNGWEQIADYEDLTSQVEMQTGFTKYSGNVYRIGKVVYVKLVIEGSVTTTDQNILKLPIKPKDNINSGCFLSSNLWATTHVGYMFISNSNGIVTTKGSSTFSAIKYDFSYIID